MIRRLSEVRRQDAAQGVVSEQRYDRGSLMSPKWHGNVLLCQGFAARPGILEYRNADGTVTRELVRPEVLAKSVGGLARCPVTLEHPSEDVRSDNHQALNVGDVDGEIEIQDDGYIRVKLAVRRKDAQNAVTSGRKRELSPGYVAKIDKTPGVHPEYGRYDAEQVERTYNHLAIVQDARGGRSVAIRTDGRVATEIIRGDAAQEQHMIEPSLIAACVRAGIDVRRLDSNETAVRMLEAVWRQDARRRGDEDQFTEGEEDYPPGDEGNTSDAVPGTAFARVGTAARRVSGMSRGAKIGAGAAAGGAALAGGAAMAGRRSRGRRTRDAEGEQEQDPNTYCDEDGNPVLDPETGAPLSKDEVIAALAEQNQELLAAQGEQANDQEVEELAPMAEEAGVDPESEEIKSDFNGVRKIDAVKLAQKIVEAHRGDSVDWRAVTHDQLSAYIDALKIQRRRDGRLTPGSAPLGRVAGRAAWQGAPRNDARDNVIRLDSGGGLSDTWLNQQSRALNSRRNGGSQ